VQNIKVEVTDKDGWRKEYVLQKVINHVGVDAHNDIVLEGNHGGGVAPRHLQIIASGDACRVVNVGNTDITIATGFDPATTAPTQIRPLPQLSSTDVIYGAWIKLGDFTVRMRFIDQPNYASTPTSSQQADATAMPLSAVAAPVAAAAIAAAAAGATASSVSQPTPYRAATVPSTPMVSQAAPSALAAAQNAGPDVPIGDSISLRLKLDQTVLGLDTPIEGSVVVRNSGTRPGAQFRLEVIGLEPECYEIGAGPILFPNAEREVAFQFVHSKKITPKAGEHRVIIRATSPDAYPGQVAVAIANIQVAPFYNHEIKLTATD
jgi:hypothetical protein